MPSSHPLTFSNCQAALILMDKRVESLENTVSTLVCEVYALRTAVTETSPKAAVVLRAILDASKTVPGGRRKSAPPKAAFGFFPFFSKSSPVKVEAKECKVVATYETVVEATTSASQAPDRPQDAKAASDNKDVGFQVPKLDLPVIKCPQTPTPLQADAMPVEKAASSAVTKVPAPAIITLPAHLMKPIPLAPVQSNGFSQVEAETTTASCCGDDMIIRKEVPIANEDKVQEAAAGLLELASGPFTVLDEAMTLIELSKHERIFNIPVEVQALLELQARERIAVVDRVEPMAMEIEPLMLLARAAEEHTWKPL
ncbi:hypothetical protein HDU97_003375, partial [Phlyctochytrium planicorne]